ncbi:hypothetical protein BZA70DRAFT_189438 [Myxozyma melibiosi]|uniref:DUF7729 domain-containing protein n=1 Tax=Myxozyma melibiosi TaxID=54550 RepID=A0ABR1F3A4_9ASCO
MRILPRTLLALLAALVLVADAQPRVLVRADSSRTATATSSSRSSSSSSISSSSSQSSSALPSAITEGSSLGFSATYTTSFTSSSSSLSSTAASSSSSILPRAFDYPLGKNFTQSSCPDFFDEFLADDDFIDCYPFSFLLQNSNSFFNTIKDGAYALSNAFDRICSVNATKCLATMNAYGARLTTSAACLDDYELQNPLATAAYNGFTAYEVMYSAGCLSSTDSGAYCFVDAQENSSALADSYLYYLPLDVSLPNSSAPTCSRCASDILAIFYSSAGNTSLALSRTYAAAADAVDDDCGANFADKDVAYFTPSAAAAGAAASASSSASSSAAGVGGVTAARSASVVAAVVVGVMVVAGLGL